jgi:acetyl esterase/lipase
MPHRLLALTLLCGGLGACRPGDGGPDSGAPGDVEGTFFESGEGEGEREGEGELPPPLSAAVLTDVAYGQDPAHRLDVFIPEGAQDEPVVIYVHGGGWANGQKENVGDKADFFVGRGQVFVSVEYRLSPETPSSDPNRVRHPDHVTDVGAAIAFVHAHAREWGGDPARLGLIGHSAGAHLVALAATDGRFIGDDDARAAVRCVFANDTEAFDIPTALDGEASRQRDIYTNAFGDDPLVQADASPITHVDDGTPPMLLTRRGSADRQQILDGYAATLDTAGVPFAIINAVGLSHADVNELAGSANDRVITPTMAAFFDECL